MEHGATLEIAVRFDVSTLPHLQLWHDLRPQACVLAIEPCTSAKINGVEPVALSGETRSYSVDIAFTQKQSTPAHLA